MELGPNRPLEEQVNRSGFPFQLAVEAAVRSSTDDHRWQVVASELPWEHGPLLQRQKGFIDLVLMRGPLFLVIECKRVDAGTWIFLTEKGGGSTQRFRAPWWNGRAPELSPLEAGPFLTKAFCDQFLFGPASVESMYCCLPKNKGPIASFETAAQEVVASAAAMAEQADVQRDADAAFYIPVIVTNAKLVACEVDSKAVNLDTGQLGSAAWSDQDVVRFRKTLTRARSNDYETNLLELEALQTDRTRSVLVVRASALTRVLSELANFRYTDLEAAPPSYFQPGRLLKGRSG